jgi:hypothetical protein
MADANIDDLFLSPPDKKKLERNVYRPQKSDHPFR